MAQKNSKFITTSSKKTNTVSKSTTTKSSPKPTNIQTSSATKNILLEQLQFQISENFIIFWLESNLNNLNEKIISQIRSIVNTIKFFTDIDQCVKSLVEIKDVKVFLIVSNSLAQQITPLVQAFTQVDSIYIFSNLKSINEQWTKAYIKIKGTFYQTETLCNVLKETVHQLNNDLISISIVPESSIDNLNSLDPSFMYCQLFKEIFLTMQFNYEIEIQQFVDYCRPRFQQNEKETKRINEFEQKYCQKSPVWWYTLECFLYNMLNNALRTVDIELLIKIGFFVRDLHQQIKQLHSELDGNKIPHTVFRGQGISNDDFAKLKKTKAGLLSFNSFLSTSTNRIVAMDFAAFNKNKSDTTCILFQIKINSSISSIPFAPISHLSAIESEYEILFSMSTVFRIGEIKKIENWLWEVNLTLTDENDPLLTRLTDHMRASLGHGNGWRRLGQLIIKMGEFKKAEEIYNTLLKTISCDDKAECAFLHNQLGYVCKQKGNLNEAFSHYKTSLEISQSYMSSNDPGLSSTYSNIGGILKKLGELDGALKYYEHALKIDLAMTGPNSLEIAIDYNNIGSVLDDQGKYPEALKNYKEALEIKRDYLPPHHSSLANTYSNIGLVYRKMGNSSTALLYYQQTLEIQKKSLLSNHPSLIVTHGNIAGALEGLKLYNEAIEHAKIALNIARHAFGSDHAECQKRKTYLEELERKC
ncbi:unnamed protein product [Rotaria sp. Silwood2]|nr:unnamed protein product [Rotaria sp. Silwood2]CAF2805855.1 unnamed protein product [Rotaria sp. Silwood2]CAF3282290.1 unnamed protein product [Rotaria sp. Silwood2]CAF4112371.1 unnamed protein product [Rotaria sp. Silwood2]CAF4218899.1 unnamed protein product [Rotaria sp. Silwood2]